MLVRDYLHQSGITKDQLADILGHKTTSMVTKKMDVEMPKRWTRLLDEADQREPSPVSDDSERESINTMHDPGSESWETRGRESDLDPNAPTGEPALAGPQTIKLSTVKGYIEMIYGGAAEIAKRRGDDVAADTITRYSPEFADAWINYIESDPRIMKYLESLMVGTPLGNLIGVHVIATGSYVFARVAARDIAAALERERATDNGATDGTAPDFVGVP